VVVKVRKPGVDELVQIDLEILTGLLDEWSPRFPVLEEYDARGLVGEFSDTLRAELDYVREAANVMFFRDTFKSELGIKVPDVINEYSKNRVLTEERLKGRKASDVADLPKAAPSRDLARPSADRGPITCAIRRWTSPSSPATCGGDLTASWAKSSAAIFGFGRASRTLMRC
jgi:ubiquinone biosynthesis protein